jgi:LysM repeat protein
MNEGTSDRPCNTSFGRAQEVQRRRRVLITSAVGAIAMVPVGVMAGSATFGLIGALLLLGPSGLNAVQVSRRRLRAINHDVGAAAQRGWSSREFEGWPSLGPRAPHSSGDLAPSSSVPLESHARPRPPLLDRWTITHLLWAGMAGRLYNALTSLAAHLGNGSSFVTLRRRLLRVTAKLLAHLGNQSIRRTVVISALATASTAVMLGTSAGAAEPSSAGWDGPSGVQAAPWNSTGMTSYTVQPGDTLAAIAQRFGTTVSALAAENDIADPNLIFAGQVLVIGQGGAAPAVLVSDTAAPTTAGTPAPPAAPATTQTGTPVTLLSTMPATVQATFACIVQAESSGNSEAYNPISQTMGLLQFLESTWLGNGGTMYAPTPLSATAQQQMNIGVLTYEHDGWSPWASDGCV